MANGLFETAQYRIAGDRGLMVEYGDCIDPAVNLKVRSMAGIIEPNPPQGLLEVAPSYRSLLLVYDPARTSVANLQTQLTALEQRLDEAAIPESRVVEIPVCYGGECGPDIEIVAQHNRLTVKQVIQIHSEPEYLIYMVGFTPGFPFLGGLPETLHTPRLKTPRTLVPEGSVGIANAQTGVYPIASPGGWQLIGRTPLRLFAPEHQEPILYRAGDRIRFQPITPEEYDRISEKEAK